MIERYSSPEMRAIWSREGELARLSLAAEACAFMSGGADLAQAVKRVLEGPRVSVARWSLLEERYDHDIAAFVAMVRDALRPEFQDQWHRGRTSSDLVEPALALGIRESVDLIQKQGWALVRELSLKARAHSDARILGRTHGQEAEPTTIGRKFALLAYELSTALEAVRVPSHAKVSGPVGTDVVGGGEALMRIGLWPTPSTQIVPRWRLARTCFGYAAVSLVVSTLATEIRLGSQSGVGWCRERSAAEEARGSSAMPHKRNPIRSERAVGLCKLIRSNVAVVAEAGAELWNERDISHSSVERTALVDLLALAEFVLADMTGVVSRLEVFEGAVRTRAGQATGLGAVEALVNSGMTYEKAYATVRDVGPTAAAIIHSVDGRGRAYDPADEPELWSVVDNNIRWLTRH